MKTWTFDEIHPPPGGPWDDEPDKAQWVDDKTGFDCLIHRHEDYGHLCGYVGLPPGHPLYEMPHQELPVLTAHGGVNYASFCQDGAEDGPGICHLPEPGRPARVWWLGFDCGHGYDYRPKVGALMAAAGIKTEYDYGGHPDRYCTFEYVKLAVEVLASQLAVAR